MIAGAPVAAAEIARYANTDESIAMMRNLVSLAKILGSIDPEVLHAVSVSVAGSVSKEARAEGFSLEAVPVRGKLGCAARSHGCARDCSYRREGSRTASLTGSVPIRITYCLPITLLPAY
jgi:hypothetical protein